MKLLRKKKVGSSHIIVLGVLVLISVFSVYIVNQLQNAIYQINAYSMQMQAYYLSYEATTASISALLADDEAALLYNTDGFPMNDSMTHTFDGVTVGYSEIVMLRKVYPYYEVESADWVQIDVTTTIPDHRLGRPEGSDFTYQTRSLVLVDNPMVQLFNKDPSELVYTPAETTSDSFIPGPLEPVVGG